MALCCYAQAPIIEFSGFYDGYWGEWHGGDNYLAKGTYNDFIAYKSGIHPSEYYFKLKFNVTDAVNGEIPKKERKRRLKNKEWYEYEGTIEFYLNEKFSTLKSWVVDFGRMGWSFPRRNQNGTTKIEVPCKIRIAPYKDKPRVYNVWFDNFGIAFIINS